MKKMGQNESKVKLQQITDSLNRIRKDLRDGKITANDAERIQGYLNRYSSEIDLNLARKARASDIYTAEQLIEITSKELDALKQEVNLDQAAVPTNSFSRTSSKKYSKEKEKNVKSIIASIEQIRELIRDGQVAQQDFDKLQARLADYSQRLSYISKKSKKQEAETAQKLASSATAELFQLQEQKNSDIVRASTTPPSQRSSIKRPKIANRNNSGSLSDIETKLEALKSDVKVAETNKDKSRLHFLSKSVQTLMTDLQMVNVNNQIINEERKMLLEKNLIRLHQQIDRLKRQLNTESNINYLAELQQKEKKEKYLQDLDDIETSVLAISRNLSSVNFESEKETFNKYKTQLNSIEELSQEIGLKKRQVADVILNIENIFTRLQMEDRLNKAEFQHFETRIDLEKFADTSASDVYKKHRQFLEQLRDYVSKILDIGETVTEKKKYVLYNISNNIVALDKKASDNEEKDEFVVLRKNTNLLSVCREVPATREMKEILAEAKAIIEQKLKLVQRDSSEAQLVTVKENFLQPVQNSQNSGRSQLKNIQKEVEALQLHIENSRYTRETQLYKDLKAKLNDYKSDVTNLSTQGDDGGRFAENLLKYIDNVLLLLENNLSSRKSTTEDILVDIMSVSTRVNDLGSKLQGFTNSIQNFDSIKSSLLEHQQYLRNLEISQNRSSLCKSRDDILQQIEGYLRKLEDLKNTNPNCGTEEEKKFNQDLRKLKEKVNRYSGTYKNVLYNAIERDLDRHLTNVDKVFKDTSVALKVKRDIENSKMILEQKSNNDQNYTTMKGKELTEIRQNLENVKQELTKIQPLTKEELDQLDARLTLSILALDNIKDDHSSERDQLYKEIKFYFARIQELQLVPKPHSVLVEDLQQKQMEQQQLAARIIAEIENELEEVKPQILNFVGSETSQKFFQLDETLVNATMRLDELNLDQTSELHHLKVKLMRDIQKYSELLDERVRQAEEIEKYEKEVQVMLIKIDSFNGYFGDPEYTYLDEEIIRLKINLGKLRVNQDLVARKEECMREIDACMKKLDEAAKTRSDAFGGTLV
ncbi:synaptonemal complex protein 1-like [Tribolium madens]|uniref:synaptonemal complex protein 1-like n=1 Tax=Tribolium madens TaxID=41895 RepID=UPI001CF750EC|nr:synaptonemal complex protein 1-like [Tribolium madens]